MRSDFAVEITIAEAPAEQHGINLLKNRNPDGSVTYSLLDL